MTSSVLPARRGDWCQMHSGIAFWPLDPRPDEILVEDIAHSLALICRFGGHCARFYSVAEHSVHVSRLCPPEARLWGLLHDASEAYIGDMIRPLKRCLPEFAAIEDGIHRAVAARFGLPPEIPQVVKDADTALLMAEARALMSPPPMPWAETMAPAEVEIVGHPPEEAERLFLDAFRELAGDLA